MVSDKSALNRSGVGHEQTSLNDVKMYKRGEVKFVGVFMPIEMYRELERIAREEDRKISQLVRLAVRRFLKEARHAEAEE